MSVKYTHLFVAVTLLLSCFTTGQRVAASEDLAKKADTIVREAERQMFSGKNNEADSLLQEAATLIDQVKAVEPDSAAIMRTEKSYQRVRQNLDKKIGNVQQKVSRQPPVAGTATQSASGGKKLPGGVSKRLKDITGHLDKAEKALESNPHKADYALKDAEQLFGEIEKGYAGQFDTGHPEVAAVELRFNQLAGEIAAGISAGEQAKTAAAGDKQAQEAQSMEWVVKFREYLSYPGQEGHNPEKLVFVPGASEPEKFSLAQQRYEAFKKFIEEYAHTEFPLGRTLQLEDIAETQAPQRLQDFEEGIASRIDSVSGDAEKQIEAAMHQLEADNGWTSDTSIKPNLVDHKWMTAIRESTEKVLVALPESDQKRREIEKKFDTLIAKDLENRKLRKERTFMTPDRYTGSDIDALKKRAQSLVEKDKTDGGTPLRCTITSTNWKEETVEEWTDTTKTAKRVRTTRSINSQVAAKNGDGVRLVTVALAQDKQSDGSWGAIYGNLHLYPEPMLAENVNK